MKFKIGDLVKCVDLNSGDSSSTSRGAGWELNKEFVVKHISSRHKESCYFPEKGAGVYEDWLELVDNTKYNRIPMEF